MMKWLLIDTSCPRAVVALSVEGRVAAHCYLTDTKKHSELLSASVQEVLDRAGLQYADLNGLGVGKGPGSFIGSRIAMAFAKGVCVALDIPLVGVGTLSALACEPGLNQGKGVAAIDARRGEYYVQTFERSAEGKTKAIAVPHLYPAEQINTLADESAFVVGTSLGHLSQSQVHNVGGPSAEGLLAAFLLIETRVDEKATLVPDYVRDPDAKPMIKDK